MYVTRDGVELHDGHWYSTSLQLRGAHCTPDGRSVGIFCAPERALTPVVGKLDENGNGVFEFRRDKKLPARFVAQASDGQDLVEWDFSNPHQPVQHKAVFAIGELPDIQPIVEADHLPESRREHLPPGAKLVNEEGPADQVVLTAAKRFLLPLG